MRLTMLGSAFCVIWRPVGCMDNYPYGTPLTQIWCFLRPGPHTGGGVMSRMRLTPPTRRM